VRPSSCTSAAPFHSRTSSATSGNGVAVGTAVGAAVTVAAAVVGVGGVGGKVAAAVGRTDVGEAAGSPVGAGAGPAHADRTPARPTMIALRRYIKSFGPCSGRTLSPRLRHQLS